MYVWLENGRELTGNGCVLDASNTGEVECWRQEWSGGGLLVPLDRLGVGLNKAHLAVQTSLVLRLW